MNVLAINGSPRSDTGLTHRLVAPFLDGAAEAGAQTEYVQLADKDIHFCSGSMHCMFKHPGQCIWDDDMTELVPKVGNADVLVLATPVYFDGPTAQLKQFVDRLVPMLDPAAGIEEDGDAVSLRGDYRVGKTVLVSTCGDFGMRMFDRLVDWASWLAKALGSEFAGALLRPHSAALEHLDATGQAPSDVYEAAREAGRQIVCDGNIAEETLAAVSRELTSAQEYLQGFRELLNDLAGEGAPPP